MLNQYKKFQQGDKVKKKSGSQYHGYIVGFYSTELTPEGYVVKSINHKNFVRMHPVEELELVNNFPYKGENLL